MRVVLESTHLDAIGGAEQYLMNFAMALEDAGAELYVTHNWPKEFEEYNGFYRTFKRYNALFEPEVFLHCSYFRRGDLYGKRNYSIVLFPKKSLGRPDWDGVISICDYSARYVSDLWGAKNIAVIEPCVREELFSTTRNTPKLKKIVSIGHFFEESDGHSKNQHVLAEAFDLDKDGFELVLIGGAGPRDEEYVRKIKKLAKGKRVRVEINKDHGFVQAELSTASHLWHANGYGRSDPAQTEHFGIIAIEAIASGVIPIVHKSGGCSEIIGVHSWERPEDLNRLTRTIQNVPRLDRRYSLDTFNKKVEALLRIL